MKKILKLAEKRKDLADKINYILIEKFGELTLEENLYNSELMFLQQRLQKTETKIFNLLDKKNEKLL